VAVRALADEDREWARAAIEQRWGSEVVVGHGTLYRPARLAGFVAEEGGDRAGLVTYLVEGDACEIVTIDAFARGRGVATALVDAVAAVARTAGCSRLWLITTNDNLDALRFYQRRGFRLVGLRPDAVARSRALKPEIPETGEFGIPILDELELELQLR